MYCPNCGAEISNGDKFCRICGHRTDLPVKQDFAFRVTYLNSWTGLVRPALTVTIDEREHYKLHQGETSVINISRGKHRVRFSILLDDAYDELDMKADMNVTVKWNKLAKQIMVEA